MSQVTIKLNEDNPTLYCIHCKTKIELGEKYLIEQTIELDEKISRTLHTDCIEEQEEDIEDETNKVNTELDYTCDNDNVNADTY